MTKAFMPVAKAKSNAVSEGAGHGDSRIGLSESVCVPYTKVATCDVHQA